MNPATPPVPGSRRRRWLRRLLWLGLAGTAAFYGAAYLVRWQPVAAPLQRRLAASFGRDVEIGNFDLSLWGGLRLEAHGVTVAEDPRFGHEYFLRAERLTAGIRWSALLAGRLEFDSVVLVRPSLNLVRTPDGQWNLENWLPWPGAALPSPEPGPLPPPAPAPRLHRVQVEGGRINFKRGVEKHPFALVGVEGTVSRAGEGQWHLDVQGRPFRAGVVVQEAGAIRVRGTLGGTSARFRPADLAVRWEEASLSDALRLLTGSDHGVRGQLNVEGRVTAPPPEQTASSPAGSRWEMTGLVRLQGIHRWDLPPRDRDPAVNLAVEGRWWPVLARAELTRVTVESSATQIRGSGFAQWGRAPAGYTGQEPAVSAHPDAGLRLVSSGISLADLFRWYPAFRAEVSGELTVEGNAGLDLEMRGWPPRLERAMMATGGARLSGLASGVEVAVSPTVLRYERSSGRVLLDPVTLRLAPPGAGLSTLLRLEAILLPGAPWKWEVGAGAQGANAGALLETAAALGVAPLQGWAQDGWQAEGLADVRLRWRGSLFPFAAEPQGSLHLRNARLGSPAFPQPLQLGSATVEMVPGEQRLAVQAVRALGATWNGTLRRREGRPWEVALSTDALDVSAAHAWLSPQPQLGLLQRLTPGSRAARAPADALSGLRARGQVSIGQLRFFSLLLGQFRSGVTLDLGAPWRLELFESSAMFFGGRVAGGLTAQPPQAGASGSVAYRVEARLSSVRLAALTAGTPRLRGFFSGTADGALTLTASGNSREALLESLVGRGRLEVRDAQTTLLDLPASLRGGRWQPGATAFALAAGGFTLAERKLALADLQLFARAARASSPDWSVTGTVDPSAGALQFDLVMTQPAAQRLPASSGPRVPPPAPAARAFLLRGPASALQFTPRR